MKGTTLAALIVFFFHAAFSQELDITEDSLAHWHRQISIVKSNEAKDSIAGLMRNELIRSFDNPALFDHAFHKLKFCTQKSPDNHIRLFNWNVPYEDGTHRYHCFVLVKDKKDENFWWTELTDAMREQEKMENKYFNADKWLGALYYEIIPMDKKKKDTYTLLGWDGKDQLTTRKIIDVLTISGKKVKLGAGVFKSDDGTRKRIILEYSEEVSSSVKYFPKKKAIVMDHLSPKNPNMVGIFADYGPDGSYDLLQMEDGKWLLKENIDVGQFAEDDDKPYKDPGKKK